ncbi:MAG: hypothetical protein ACUVSV_15080, partial [Armatimonadota bacterium]
SVNGAQEFVKGTYLSGLRDSGYFSNMVGVSAFENRGLAPYSFLLAAPRTHVKGYNPSPRATVKGLEKTGCFAHVGEMTTALGNT